MVSFRSFYCPILFFFFAICSYTNKTCVFVSVNAARLNETDDSQVILFSREQKKQSSHSFSCFSDMSVHILFLFF